MDVVLTRPRWISDLGFPPIPSTPSRDRYLGLFVSHASVRNAVQYLDRLILVSSEFDNCELIYDGSTLAYFDKSNRLVNTFVLHLGPRAKESDQFVQQFKSDFPNVRIVKDPPDVGIYGRDGKRVPEP